MKLWDFRNLEVAHIKCMNHERSYEDTYRVITQFEWLLTASKVRGWHRKVWARVEKSHRCFTCGGCFLVLI